jgi:hypothetical protein
MSPCAYISAIAAHDPHRVTWCHIQKPCTNIGKAQYPPSCSKGLDPSRLPLAPQLPGDRGGGPRGTLTQHGVHLVPGLACGVPALLGRALRALPERAPPPGRRLVVRCRHRTQPRLGTIAAPAPHPHREGAPARAVSQQAARKNPRPHPHPSVTPAPLSVIAQCPLGSGYACPPLLGHDLVCSTESSVCRRIAARPIPAVAPYLTCAKGHGGGLTEACALSVQAAVRGPGEELRPLDESRHPGTSRRWKPAHQELRGKTRH